jgi:hypothetical protein
MAFCNAVGKVSNWSAVGVPLADMLLLLWWTMYFALWEWYGMSHSCCQFQRSALYLGMDSNISHSNECIICILILCDISTSIVPIFTLQLNIQFFCKQLLFQFECQACQPIIGSASWPQGPPSNMYQQLLPTPDITTCLSCFQARVVVIMEKERCHGCDKWFAQIDQHLMYHNHCQLVMVEHACQQRLIVEYHNHNNAIYRNNSCCFCPLG